MEDHGGEAMMMKHTINMKEFDKDRIDELVSHGAIEVWTFDNTEGDEPHPMHLHGHHFQVVAIGGLASLQRHSAGRGSISPSQCCGFLSEAPAKPIAPQRSIANVSRAYRGDCHDRIQEDPHRQPW